MTVPADGVPRLMHFVDARLTKLRMSREEANRRGFPNFSTLAAVRDRDTQNTPRVRTLLRIDRTLGWQPGSAGGGFERFLDGGFFDGEGRTGGLG